MFQDRLPQGRRSFKTINMKLNKPENLCSKIDFCKADAHMGRLLSTWDDLNLPPSMDIPNLLTQTRDSLLSIGSWPSALGLASPGHLPSTARSAPSHHLLKAQWKSVEQERKETKETKWSSRWTTKKANRTPSSVPAARRDWVMMSLDGKKQDGY